MNLLSLTRLVPVLSAAALLAACAPSHQIQSAGDIGALPQSRGVNTGSLDTVTPWKYLGSGEESHAFDYYYHIGAALRHRRVIIDRASAKVHFPETFVGASQKWVTLEKKGGVLHFSPYRPKLPLHLAR